MRRFVFAFCLVSAGAFGATFSLDPSKSRVAFTYQQMGAPAEGEFQRYAAQVSFDAARPAVSQVLFTLDIAGVDTGLAEVNKELQRPAFLTQANSRRRALSQRRSRRWRIMPTTLRVN